MFVHFVFLVYLVSLVAGVGLLAFLWPRLQGREGSRELFWLYGLCSLFMVAGGACLYLRANVLAHQCVILSFMIVAFSVVGAFTYWIPHFHAVRAHHPLPRKHQHFLIAGAVLGPVAGFVAVFTDGWVSLLLIAVPFLVLLIAIGYGNAVSKRCDGEPLRFQLLVPLFAVALGAAEGIFWGDYVWEHGVSLTLPLIYGITNAFLWFNYEPMLGLSEGALPNTLSASASVDCAALTPKENEVVRAVRRGLTNKQIAHELDVSPSTVKNHLHNIFKKLNVNSRTALFTLVRSGEPGSNR